MYGDSFFHTNPPKIFDRHGNEMFSSPCVGILFSPSLHAGECGPGGDGVFVPMFGDSFFTAGLGDPTVRALYCPFTAGIFIVGVFSIYSC